MQIKAQELADLVSGRVEGDGEVLIHAPAKIEEAQEGTITFLANPKYEEYIYSTQASVVLVGEDFQPRVDVQPTLIYVSDVYKTLAFLLQKFGETQQSEHKISELAFIHPDAQVSEKATIGPFCVVEKDCVIGEGCVLKAHVYVGEGAQIGDQSTLYPGVTVYHKCEIGKHCILHAGAVIGSDGFGFSKDDKGNYQKIPQIGNVILGDHVEIGAQTVIDRATMGSTRIHGGAKLGNLIQIAHNVEIGSNTVIAAQTGIAGSTRIGEDALIGGQVGIVGHIKIANKTMIQAGSGINKSIEEEGTKLYGYPAIPYTQYLRAYSVFRELPDLRKRLAVLEKMIADQQKE